jgi:PAS domain S-box-containing protein
MLMAIKPTYRELEGRDKVLEKEALKQRRAKESLKALGKKYSALVDNSPDIIYILDPEGHFNFVGGALEELLGFTAEELIGKHFTTIIWPEDVKEAEWRVNERRTGERSTKGFEVRLITKRGKGKHFNIKYLPVELYTFGVYDKPVSANDKKFLGTYGAARDINNRKRAEEKLKQSLKEKEILLQEVHHRVKNNLQVISSLFDMRAMRTDNQGVVNFLEDTRSKIHTMALIHTQLYRSERFDRIDMGSHIRELVEYLSRIYITKSVSISTVIEAQNVYLSVTQAIPCALVINELVSNAFKHALKGREKGTVEISLKRTADDMAILIVKDDGIGVPEEIDILKTNSLGFKLLRNTVQDQLRGNLSLQRGAGTTITVEFTVIEES